MSECQAPDPYDYSNRAPHIDRPIKLLFKTQRVDPIGRVVFLPSVIFDFDCYPVGTSLTFSALFVVAVVAADVVVVGVFFFVR